jgi:mevalonate kinase
MYFDSNIPQGYGVGGSSGALVAAVFYDKYAIEKNYGAREFNQRSYLF